MKCDKLKLYRTHTDNLGDNYIDAEFVDVVLKEDVDEAIAELKEEVNNLLMQNRELCQALQVMYSAEEYAKLQAENAKLKAANKLLKEHIANGDVSRITWIDEVIELKEAQRWRKFSEEKPQWGVDVLMLSNEGEMLKARFSFDYKWISWGMMKTCESDCITHWMPLPEQPKEADK